MLWSSLSNRPEASLVGNCCGLGHSGLDQTFNLLLTNRYKQIQTIPAQDLLLLLDLLVMRTAIFCKPSFKAGESSIVIPTSGPLNMNKQKNSPEALVCQMNDIGANTI